MARIHVLESGSLNEYTIVVHAPTPGGTNSAGVSWATAIANSGRNVSRMTVGNGAGQITNTEATNVGNGSVIEAVFQFTDDPAWDTATRNARLDAEATKLVAETQARYSQELKFFGATRN